MGLTSFATNSQHMLQYVRRLVSWWSLSPCQVRALYMEPHVLRTDLITCPFRRAPPQNACVGNGFRSGDMETLLKDMCHRS